MGERNEMEIILVLSSEDDGPPRFDVMSRAAPDR
jgi:hypothetical protein